MVITHPNMGDISLNILKSLISGSSFVQLHLLLKTNYAIMNSPKEKVNEKII